MPAIPLTTAVFCDIPNLPPAAPHCASADEQSMGIRLAAAAVALNTGSTTTIALDDSPAALAACGGAPRAIVFQGAFPQGQSACGDPTTVTDANAFCAATCKGIAPDPADPAVVAFCDANAHASTNVPVSAPGGPGFAAGCVDEGTLRTDFDDPRKTPEVVVWTDLNGTSASAGTLTRTAATTGGGAADFNAGAASTQWFSRGDGYVEFSTGEVGTKSHVAGLSQIPGGCPAPCTDVDPGLNDINFGISLNSDGRVYIIESGSLIPGPDLNGSFGTYVSGERFRVTLKQSSSPTTATVTYSRVTATCVPGNTCPESPIFTHAGVATYPLRVDASFREQGAILSDVRIVRIQ